MITGSGKEAAWILRLELVQLRFGITGLHLMLSVRLHFFLSKI